MEPTVDNPRVVYLAAGAGGMYCGSCIRDNRLAATLLAQGRDVTLMPLYTPLRTDETNVSRSRVHYGGINVYLEDRFHWYRRVPRALTRILDMPALLGLAGRLAASTQPEDVGDLAVSILRGAHGPQREELDRLIEALRAIRPTLVNLPNLMFAGVAKPLSEALGVPVVCTLSGEDIFLDQLPEPHRSDCFSLIRDTAQDIDAFISVTEYFAEYAATHFGLSVDRVHVVPLGIAMDEFSVRTKSPDDVFTIGYLARICEEKGLMNLVDAVIDLIREGRNCRLRVAGYLGAGDKPYLKAVRNRVRAGGIQSAFEFLGEVDRPGKIRLLQSLDVMSVPTNYHEAKGLYILEALACGVPVVQPRHGSFPELIRQTEGGVLYDPAQSGALTAAIRDLMDQPARLRQLGDQGRQRVHEQFTDQLMADRTWALYEKICRDRKVATCATELPR